MFGFVLNTRYELRSSPYLVHIPWGMEFLRALFKAGVLLFPSAFLPSLPPNLRHLSLYGFAASTVLILVLRQWEAHKIRRLQELDELRDKALRASEPLHSAVHVVISPVQRPKEAYRCVQYLRKVYLSAFACSTMPEDEIRFLVARAGAKQRFFVWMNLGAYAASWGLLRANHYLRDISADFNLGIVLARLIIFLLVPLIFFLVVAHWFGWEVDLVEDYLDSQAVAETGEPSVVSRVRVQVAHGPPQPSKNAPEVSSGTLSTE